jgi:tetratricopeptide (TPR) repeat protein
MKSFLPLGRFALILAMSLVSASPGPAQDLGPDEVVAYQAWYAANSQNMGEQATEAARAYLAKFPNGKYAAYLKGWLLGPRLKAFDAAVQAKNTDEMIKVGREILKESPTSLGVCYSLAFNLRRLEFLASPENYAHAAEAVEFSAQAIKMIEGGQVIEGGRFNKNASLALLHQIQAMVAGNGKNGAEAIELYTKSLAADPGNPALAPNNLLSLASLYREPFGAAVAAYQAFPEADRQAAAPSAEVKAALAKVHAAADPLIDAWARFVAFARARNVEAGTRDQVFAGLQSVYSTRYGGDVSGLAPLIEKLQAEYAPKAS